MQHSAFSIARIRQCPSSNISARTADASSRRSSPATESRHVRHARAPISTNCCRGPGWSAPANRRAQAPANPRLAGAALAVPDARAARARTDARKPNHSPRRNSAKTKRSVGGQKCPPLRQGQASVGNRFAPQRRARAPRLSYTLVLVSFTYVLTRRSEGDHRQGD